MADAQQRLQETMARCEEAIRQRNAGKTEEPKGSFAIMVDLHGVTTTDAKRYANRIQEMTGFRPVLRRIQR